MRHRVMMVAAVLLLSSAVGMARAQSADEAEGTQPQSGLIDFGVRFGTVDGDAARHERYRDLRDGATSLFLFTRETDRYAFEAKATNVGYRDQRYTAGFTNGRVGFSFLFDAIPLNYSYLTRSPWQSNGAGVLTLSTAARTAVQAGSAVGVPCSAGGPPATCNNPGNADRAKAARSIYNDLASPLDLQVKREILGFGGSYQASKELGLNLAFTTTGRKGEQPWGASYAFSNSVELPLPLDQRTNDLSASLEWSAPKGMFRVGWDGSWFNNAIQTLVWDNPIRITDYDNGLTPPAGPYNSSAYSNGLGPAQGQMALAPSHTQHVFSFTGLYKMPHRTTLNGTFQYTSQAQDEALIPWTTNPVINQPVVWAAFPHLAELPRPTARAKAKGFNFLLNLTSRPVRHVGLNVRYRINERDNYTPEFDGREYVRFDGVPEEAEHGMSVQYDTTRQTLDASVTFALSQLGSLKVGYGWEGIDRNGRGYSAVTDKTFRVSFDTLQLQYLSVRASYDHSARRGEGFVEAGVDYEEGPGGTQPSLRYFDESDRDRDRGSLLVTLMPVDLVDVYVQFTSGKEAYKPETFEGRRDPFGLLESKVTAWTVGVNVTPVEKVTFGASYGSDEFKSLQQSRNASPPPSSQWTDPTRNWTLNNDETVKNVNVYLDLNEALARTNLRVSYDRSESDNAFRHGGPRIVDLAAAGQFLPLPTVTNEWQQFKADLKFYFTDAVGVGFAYWYEKFDVRDYNTIDSNGPVGLSTVAGQPVATQPTGEPRIDWLGGLMLGYGNRPYTGNTGFVRLLYRF